ncbi:hypothetical protein CYJ37_06455 [Bacillus sp. UMB0728]|nr:hypothetical protein B9K06_08335 [Bacillus sp. OG2]PLR73190.1 hypothetical protein CYJ37_06455 [Bacillus sp. UMB0728]
MALFSFEPRDLSLWPCCFREDEFKVNQIELNLGPYYSAYNEVLIRHTKPSGDLSVMYQAINIYTEMLNVTMQ